MQSRLLSYNFSYRCVSLRQRFNDNTPVEITPMGIMQGLRARPGPSVDMAMTDHVGTDRFKGLADSK
jgi:hypothetical protein